MVFQDFEKMRVRDLRRYLTGKLEVPLDEVAKLLDKRELIDLAYRTLGEKKVKIATSNSRGYSWAIVIFVTLILFLFLTKDLMKILLHSIKDWQSASTYKLTKKTSMMRFSLRNFHVLGFTIFLVSMTIDLYCMSVQLMVLVGWILGRHSFLYVDIPTLSVPLSPGDIFKNNTLSTSTFGTMLNSGLDVGPMITMWILQSINNKLEEFGASKIIPIVEAREQRRAAKKMRNQTWQFPHCQRENDHDNNFNEVVS